jgi:hypothetical protein
MMRYYDCLFTVEGPEEMWGEYWITVEVEDIDENKATIDENEFWFLNPEIFLSIVGDIEFDDVTPGTNSYSSSVTIENDADLGSGVLLDMFISGTDFYDSESSGAMCPISNVLELENFAYYAINAGYDTYADPRADVEGYVPINYGIGFNDPTPFYNSHEIIQVLPYSAYYLANILSPGSEMTLTFRLSLPEPCNGNFDSGKIRFYGEVI